MKLDALKFLLLAVTIVSAKCPHPGIPRNGVALKYWPTGDHKATDQWNSTSQVSCLASGETVRFKCAELWDTSFTEVEYVECMANGTLKGSLPTCLKKVASTDWQVEFLANGELQKEMTTNGNFTCDGVKYSEIRFKPSIRLRLSDVIEIRLTSCADSDAGSVKISVNNVRRCNLEGERERIKIFACYDVEEELTHPLEFISINTNGSISISNVVVLIRSDNNCGYPPVPVNGQVRVSPNDEAKYSCRNKYIPLGNLEAKCQPSTGKWSTAPKCGKDQCSKPPDLKNGRAEWISERKYQFVCQENFTLSDPNFVECDPLTGKWGPIPICEQDLCGPVPVPPNGRVELVSAGRYHFYCNNHPTVGNNTMECDASTGEWRPIPICQAENDISGWLIYAAVTTAGLIIAGIVIHFNLRRKCHRETAPLPNRSQRTSWLFVDRRMIPIDPLSPLEMPYTL